MDLEATEIWSPDLNPPSSGLPSDMRRFSAFMQVAVAEKGKQGGEVFGFFASSPALEPDSGPALIFDTFDWTSIRTRVSELLESCRDCKTWDGVISKLSPYLDYSDK